MRFLRRYQPVQVLRSRNSCGFDLSQGGTWLPLSHIGLFISQCIGTGSRHQGRKSRTRSRDDRSPAYVGVGSSASPSRARPTPSAVSTS